MRARWIFFLFSICHTLAIACNRSIAHLEIGGIPIYWKAIIMIVVLLPKIALCHYAAWQSIEALEVQDRPGDIGTWVTVTTGLRPEQAKHGTGSTLCFHASFSCPCCFESSITRVL